MYYDTIRMTKNSEGKKVLNEIFTIENKIGSGGFCDVLRCNGYFEETDETVPYALKEYRTATLNQTVTNAQASNLTDAMSNLGIRKMKDQVIDEVEFWGKLKHDNIVKVFTWYEDYKTPENLNPYDRMYLMM